MKKIVLALALAAVLFGTMFTAPRNSYAHTFSGDESASFLLLVESIKIELQLVESNLASNTTLAEEHAEHAHQALDEHTLEEISERNKRLGRDLPAALEDLHDSVATSTEQQVQSKIQNINDLLDETVTVRVEPAQMTNSTVQALVMANMLRAIQFEGHGHYEIALGIGGEEHTHEEEHDEHGDEEHGEGGHSSSEEGHGEMSSSNETGEHSSGSHNMTEGPAEIVNMAHYQTAQAFAVRAQELWTELKPKAPSRFLHSISEIDAALPDLIEAINDKAPINDVSVIIHGRIHPNMITAFELKLAGHTEEHDEHEEGDHGAHSKIPERLRMYAKERGAHIHEEHLAENAPISGMYEADMRYTLTLTGEATSSMPHDSMEPTSMSDDGSMEGEQHAAEITLDLATWKSTGRVLHLDIIGGSITIGDENMTVNAGQAYYITNHRVMYAFAVVMPENGDEDSMQLLRLKAILPADNKKLPAAESDQPLEIDTINTRTKIGSDWFLEMSGQIVLS
jgi:ferritin-like protein